MGLSYDAFSARLRNRVVFLADEIRQLISSVPDFRIAAWLLRDSRFIAADRGRLDDPELPLAESLRHSVLHVLIKATERAIATLRAHVQSFTA